MPSEPLDPKLYGSFTREKLQSFREELQTLRDKSFALFAVEGRVCCSRFCESADVLDAFLARDLLDAQEP